MTLGITPKPDTAFEASTGRSNGSSIEHTSVAIGKPISETELEVVLGPVKTLNFTVQHYEVETISESDRIPEEFTSRAYDYDIFPTFEDLLGINSSPTIVTTDFTEELNLETELGQDVTDGPGVTIQHETDIVSKSTLLTTDKTPEDYTSKKHEHDISTTLEDSPGISTSSPTVIISQITEELHSESEPEMGEDATQGLVKTAGVDIQHEEVDIVSESTLMTSDRTPEDSTSGKYEYVIPTSFEDWIEIVTIPPTVLTNEATVKQDDTEGPVKTLYITIPNEKVDIVSESTLMTTDSTPEDSTSVKYEYVIPTSFEDSLEIITSSPTELTNEATVKATVKQDATEDHVKRVEVTIPHEEFDIVSESTLMTTDRNPEDTTLESYEYILPTSFEDSLGIMTSSPTELTNEATVKQDDNEGPVKTLYVTIPNEKADIVSESTLMTTDSTPEDSTSGKYQYVIPTSFEDSLEIITSSPTELTNEATVKATVKQDATEDHVKRVEVTIPHEEFDIVSESTLMTTDRNPEDTTLESYEYILPTSFEDSLGIMTSSPTELTNEATVKQDDNEGPVKTLYVTIPNEKADIVSESTLMTTDSTPEDSTSGKYEYVIPTSFEDSLEIITSSPTELTNEATVKATVKQDATEDHVKREVTIPHEEFDIVSESTLMTTDRNPEDTTSENDKYILPTSFEDSLGITTSSPTELTNEATVKQDVSEGLVKTAEFTIPHDKADIVSESTLMTTDSTPEDSTSGKYQYVIPTSFDDSLETITSSPTELTNEATVKATVKQDATEDHVKREVTIPHEEFDIVSESTLMTTDRNPEDTTSENYKYILPTSFEDSLGITTSSPTELTNEATVKQDVSEGLVKTAEFTIPHDKADIVSESTLMTTDSTPEDSTSGKYQYVIPTSFDDSLEIITSSPTELTNEATVKATVKQDATEDPVKTEDVTIPYEEFDIVSESTLMATDINPEDTTSENYTFILPTSFEDSLGITTSSPTELTNEATVKQDVSEGLVKTAEFTIPHDKFDIVSESTLMTSASNPEYSTSGKYDYGIPTSFEDSVGISTNTPKEITSESTKYIISVTKLYMGQGVTEGPLKSADATIQYVEVSEAMPMHTGRTPISSTSRKYETDLHTTLGYLPGISTNTPVVVTRESIDNFISETEVEDGWGVTETPVKSALVTIQHGGSSEATMMTTGRPTVGSLTEIPPVQSVLPEKPVQTTPTELKEVSPNPPTEGLPKALTDRDVVEITHVTTKPEMLSPTTPVNTSPEVVSTEGGSEYIAIVTLLDKDEEEKVSYTKPTPEGTTDEELPGTMTESTHELSKETDEPIDDSSDAEEDYLGKEEDIITETPEVVEVTAGETPRLTQETTEATVLTEKYKHVDKDITAIVKPGEMTTEGTEVAEVEFHITTDDVLENMLEDFVGGTSEATAELGDVTEAVISEESSENSTAETSTKRTETYTKTTSQTTTGITSKATPDTSFDIGTPETDIVEFVTEGMEDKVEDTTKKDEGGEENLFKIFEGTMPDLTVTKLEKDILTTTINEDIRKVTEPSKTQQDTPKVVVEITYEVTDMHETRGDSISETPKANTEADIMTETAHVISQPPKVISQAPEVETSGSTSKTPAVISQTPLSVSELLEVPETVPTTPEIRVVQPEPAEDNVPTPLLKVEDMTVVLNDLTTTIQKTFSTTLQSFPQDLSNDILDENSMVSTFNL